MNSCPPLNIDQLKSLTNSLQQEDYYKMGRMLGVGRWTLFVNSITKKRDTQLHNLINKMNATLAALEQKGIKLFDPNIVEKEYLQKAAKYRESRQVYLNTVDAIGKQMKKLHGINPKLNKAFQELKCRERGLLYSLGQSNGGFDILEKPSIEWFGKIKEAAINWKKKQPLSIDSNLNELEIGQIEELAKYPEWLKIVYDNPSYLNEVFSWCLRDFNPVEVIVKCFETQKRLKKALLSPNLGYVKNILLTKKENEVLAFTTIPAKKAENVKKRILTLSIYHGRFDKFESHLQERINILDPKTKVHFKQGNHHLTVAQLFKEFSQKNAREVDFNMCADWGIVPFNPVKGMPNADKKCYDMPKLEENNWIDQIPASRIASHAELLAQYGEDKLKDRDFFFKIMATRQSKDLNVLNCHAYWQLFFRMKDGNWKVLNIGLYAYRFQQGLLDGLWLFCHTLRRVVCLMDQNGGYSHRQRGGCPFFLSKSEEQNFLKNFFKLLHSQGVFQFAGRNCAFAVQKNAEKSLIGLPNLFKIPVTWAKTGAAPLDKILAWAKHQKKWVKESAVTFLHTILLSFRTHKVKKKKKEVQYSVSEFLNNQKHEKEIFVPAFLPYNIDEAMKKGMNYHNGELYWGHTGEKMPQFKAMAAMAASKSEK